ncbi:hypothetical protein H0H92_006843 [Tricholoma furcatifolium]|nr:hypothetical protein H0H92_006843 [Tricholoma furcatifolium]
MLPTVRLPSFDGREHMAPEGVVLEMPSSSKFSVSSPTGTRTTSTPPAAERVALNFTEADSESSDGDSANEGAADAEEDEGGRTKSPPVARMSGTARSNQPQLSRALSMPLPSQLKYLRNPRRSGSAASQTPEIASMSNAYRLDELSIELADSVQMMVQTMLQISPPQLLDPAKEQFSACSLSVPTSAMSAMLTSMQTLNYIAANMGGLCSAPEDEDVIETPLILSDFDIGELLQSVGDSLSGIAAKAGVDLVLYHGDDVGLRHVCVKGAENGIALALSHIVRQVIATAQPSDTIELGLIVGPISTDDDRAPPESEDPVACKIRISHKFSATSTAPRPKPYFSANILKRLLRQLRATLTPDLPPPKSFTEGRTCDFVLALDRGTLSVVNTPAFGQDDGTSGEPSVEQLILFAEGLRGKRVSLYANAKGSFAQRLTSYLTAWGMEIAHVSPDGKFDGLPDCPPSPTVSTPSPTGPPKYENSPTSPTPSNEPPSFIFIDDDIDVLKQRLNALRAGKDKPYPLNLNLRKRPSLAAHHRPRSTPQVNRVAGTSSTPLPGSVVLVHFCSIGNYKLIKDIVQSIAASRVGSDTPLPEIMIIPKPVGPRRFLTALHTAVTKPVVDPFFTPIATTPSSPTIHTNGSYLNSYSSSAEPTSPRSSPKPSRPSGTRTNSDRSNKTAVNDVPEINTHALPPPSPLSISDNVEYFSETAAKLGASSSGLMIESPDGQPAGIFFHPRAKSPRNLSAQLMERDKGQLVVPEHKRRSSRLSVSSEGTMSFSSLHANAGANISTSPTSISPTRRSPSESRPTVPAAKPAQSSRKSSMEGEKSPAPPASASRKPTSPEVAKATPPGSPQLDSAAVNSAAARRTTPRRESVAQSPSPSTALAAASRKAKALGDGKIPPVSVLIVDDNPINQTILSTFMKKKKIKYDLANNGEEAVKKFKEGDFHLILMDIQMPVMDGIQATKEIRRLEQENAADGYPPGNGTPTYEENTALDASPEQRAVASPHRSSVIIVALTASSLQSDRVAALAAGCNDFLTKPVSLVWLNSKIIEWGSLKALQMWADHTRPAEEINKISNDAARNIAERLHVPPGRSTPSPSRQMGRMPSSRTTPPPGARSSSPNNFTGNGMSVSPTSPMSWTHDRSSQTPLWELGAAAASPPSGQGLRESKG